MKVSSTSTVLLTISVVFINMRTQKQFPSAIFSLREAIYRNSLLFSSQILNYSSNLFFRYHSYAELKCSASFSSILNHYQKAFIHYWFIVASRAN